MPTAKPRVNVAMDQADFDLLSAFAASQGVSRASVLVDLWQMAAPVMARVLKLVEEAERAKASVKDGIREAAIQAEARVQPLHREMLLNLDLFEEAIRDVIQEAAGISDPADAGGGVRSATPPADDGQGDDPNPRPVTRGSGFRKGRGVKQSRGG